jgi:hypothetical protein
VTLDQYHLGIHIWSMLRLRRELIWSLNAHLSADARVSAARARSMELLVENLSPTQRAQYKRWNYFDVIGSDTGNRYRIRRAHVLNVELLDDNGRRTAVLCFMPEGHLPMGDVMLSQKLALELFEAQAINVANRSPIRDWTPARDIRLQYRSRR